MPLITDFLVDCFSEMNLSSNLQILNTCREWREILLEVSSSNNKIKIGTTYGLKKYKKNELSNLLCGTLDHKSLICSYSTEYRMTTGSNILVLSSHMNDRLFLCSPVRDNDYFCLLDAKHIDVNGENYPFKTSDFVNMEHYLVHTYDNGFRIQTSNRRSDIWVWFNEYGLLSFNYINIFRKKQDAEYRIEALKNITNGDKIEFVNQKTKHVVELVVPPKNEMDEIPLWYIPQLYRYPNTIVIKEDDSYLNIPLFRVGQVFKAGKIPSYCFGSEIMHVGFYVVLFAPDFPMGYVKSTGEKYYTAIFDGKKYSLRYGQPLYKIFEKRKNAERWRRMKLDGLKERIAKIRPGDIIMKTFVNRFLIKTNQTYTVVRKISMTENTDKGSIDMEEIDRFLVLNHLDDESSSEGMLFFFPFSIQSKKNRGRRYPADHRSKEISHRCKGVSVSRTDSRCGTDI